MGKTLATNSLIGSHSVQFCNRIVIVKNWEKWVNIGERGQYLVNMYKKGQNSQNLAKLMEIDQKG